MATGNTSTFFGRNARNATPRNATPNRMSSRLNAAHALELISADETHELTHQPPRTNLAGRPSRCRNSENVLPYQPGMLLRDRPSVYDDGDLEPGDGEDAIYTFGDVSSSRNKSEITEIKSMIQQQQAMMRSILMNQETMQERQALYEQKVKQLEDKLVQCSPQSSSDGSPSACKKRKVIVNRGISVSDF